jgi:hypothetical protein
MKSDKPPKRIVRLKFVPALTIFWLIKLGTLEQTNKQNNLQLTSTTFCRFNPYDIIFDPNILTIATGMGKFIQNSFYFFYLI